MEESKNFVMHSFISFKIHIFPTVQLCGAELLRRWYLLSHLRITCHVELITVLIWTISWIRWIQFTLTPCFLSFVHLTISRGLIPSNILTKILYAFLICVKCAAGLIFLSSQDLITWRLFGEGDQLGSSLLCSFLHPPVPFNQSLIGLASFMHKLHSVRSLHKWMVSLLETADTPSHCIDVCRMYCLKLLDYVKIHIDHVW